MQNVIFYDGLYIIHMDHGANDVILLQLFPLQLSIRWQQTSFFVTTEWAMLANQASAVCFISILLLLGDIKTFIYCCSVLFGFKHQCLLIRLWIWVYLRFESGHLDHSVRTDSTYLVSKTASNYPVTYLAQFSSLHLSHSRFLADAKFSLDCSLSPAFHSHGSDSGFRTPFMGIDSVCVQTVFWGIVPDHSEVRKCAMKMII